MKRISVVIPLFNRGDFIAATLRSIEKQKRIPDEIIIVDDFSTDHSAASVRHFAGDSSLPVKLIDNQGKKGVSGATNTGIAAANGDYIALLDSDDLWMPNHLGQLEQALERFPQAGAAFSRIEVFGDAADTAIKEKEFKTAVQRCVRDAFCQADEGIWLSGDRLLAALLNDGVPFRCQASLLRKSVIDGHRLLFDEEISYTQDAQFLTIAACHTPFVYVDVSGLLLRRHHENDGDRSYKMMQQASYERRVTGLKAFFNDRRLSREEKNALGKRLAAMEGEALRIRAENRTFPGKLAEAAQLLVKLPCRQGVKEVLRTAYRNWLKGIKE